MRETRSQICLTSNDNLIKTFKGSRSDKRNKVRHGRCSKYFFGQTLIQERETLIMLNWVKISISYSGTIPKYDFIHLFVNLVQVMRFCWLIIIFNLKKRKVNTQGELYLNF